MNIESQLHKPVGHLAGGFGFYQMFFDLASKQLPVAELVMLRDSIMTAGVAFSEALPPGVADGFSDAREYAVGELDKRIEVSGE